MSRLLDQGSRHREAHRFAVSDAASVPTRACSNRDAIFAAWLGLTPRQTRAGASRRSSLTKQGQPIHKEDAGLGGRPRCHLNVLGKRKGALRDWFIGLPGEEAGAAGYGGARKQAGPEFSGR